MKLTWMPINKKARMEKHQILWQQCTLVYGTRSQKGLLTMTSGIPFLEEVRSSRCLCQCDHWGLWHSGIPFCTLLPLRRLLFNSERHTLPPSGSVKDTRLPFFPCEVLDIPWSIPRSRSVMNDVLITYLRQINLDLSSCVGAYLLSVFVIILRQTQNTSNHYRHSVTCTWSCLIKQLLRFPRHVFQRLWAQKAPKNTKNGWRFCSGPI